MEHEALDLPRAEGVELLRVSDGAQRRDGQHLGLSSGEEPCAVGARQQADLAANGADLLQAAAVGPGPAGQDARPEGRVRGVP